MGLMFCVLSVHGFDVLFSVCTWNLSFIFCQPMGLLFYALSADGFDVLCSVSPWV